MNPNDMSPPPPPLTPWGLGSKTALKRLPRLRRHGGGGLRFFVPMMWVPNMARKAQHYRTSVAGATQNFSQMGGLLQCKGQTVSLKEPKLREMARRWDIPCPPRWTPMPLGPRSEILCQYPQSSSLTPCSR